MGAAQKIWGIEIYRDRDKNKVFLVIENLYSKNRFGMSSTKLIDTL